MPELPEVETVARQLQAVLPGKKLRSVQVLDKKLGGFARYFSAGSRALRVFRRGKLVVIEFSGMGKSKSYLCVHLRMTGRLIWAAKQKKKSISKGGSGYFHETSTADKHLRARLSFDKGELLFYDTRRFGTMSYSASIEEIPCRGLDPITEEFNPELLAGLISGTKQALKAWLLRQDKLIGIGNIYASEILFEAKLSPRRKTSRLKKAEIESLYRATRSILERAIKHCGTTFSDFQDSRGEVGGFQNFLKVYERENEKCVRCKTPVKRIVQQQRSTYFCPGCQS